MNNVGANDTVQREKPPDVGCTSSRALAMITIALVAVPTALRTGVATVARRRAITKRAETLAACAASQLPARLQAVLDATPSTTVVAADIGCDHGLLSVAQLLALEAALHCNRELQ